MADDTKQTPGQNVTHVCPGCGKVNDPTPVCTGTAEQPHEPITMVEQQNLEAASDAN